MLAVIHGDVVIQTLGATAGVGLTAWAAVASARRSGRAEKALKPNGGASFRDVVDRRFLAHDERLDRMDR